MKNLKSLLRNSFPGVYISVKNLFYFLYGIFTGKKHHRVIFEKIYKTNSWMDDESRSGSGSNLENTLNIRRELPLLVKGLNIKSLVDIPCGDFYWMQKVNTDVNSYTGADIVPELINNNQKLYGNEKRKFILLDLTEDNLPAADLILCRDCLPHLSFKNIFSAIDRIKKSGSGYLLTSTYINRELNRDIETGLFRPLNLQLPPFNFPEPLKLIEDKCIDKRKTLEDKMLGLWQIKDL
ncbi:MAG: hypothetical protein R6W90_05705 [Ignavibacteriaceae bacterium]